MKPVAIYTAAMTLASSTAGALLPGAPRELHTVLFTVCVAFSLATIAALWVPPSAKGAER